MKHRFLVPCLAALLVLGACSKDEDKSQAKSDESEATESESDDKAPKDGDAPAPVASKDAPPPDPSKADAMWARAPQGTVMGMIAAPGSGLRLHAMALELFRVVGSQPIGAEALMKMREATVELPFNIFEPEGYKKIGFDLSLGAGFFMSGKKQGLVILPVADRAAFRALTKGKIEKDNGVEYDRIEDDFVCTQKEVYVCSKSIEALKEMGQVVNGPMAKRIAALPIENRGHAEFALDVPGLRKQEDDFDPEFDELFSEPGLGIAALRFGDGVVSARVFFETKTKGPLAAASSVPSSVSRGITKHGPAGLFSLRVPVALLMANMPVGEDIQIPNTGISVRDDILGNLTGEILAFAGSSERNWGRLAWGIKDAGPFTTLLNMGCGMSNMLPGVTATPGDGTCSAIVDASKMNLPSPELANIFTEPVAISVDVKSDQMSITLGEEAPPKAGSRLTSLGQELLTKNWNYALWARDISIANALGSAVGDLDKAGLPTEAITGIKLGVWLLAHVNEVGIAAGVRPDGLHAVFHLGTYAGDSPEAYLAYETAVAKTLGGANAEADFAALATNFPDSMAGRAGSGGGSVMLAGVTGMLAAVAIPAFMKYVERSKSVEAQMMLENVSEDAAKFYAEDEAKGKKGKKKGKKRKPMSPRL